MTTLFAVAIALLLQLATAAYGVGSGFRYHSPGHYVISFGELDSGYRTAAFAAKADDEFQVDLYPFKSALPALTRCFPDKWFLAFISSDVSRRLPQRCLPLFSNVIPLASKAS
ncbi:Uncharacterized protein PBTT_09582 [Plasmodiophora brassicae]|uniref:Uncharacterized protein n=1 Tax=Plasmodiophora brassicae TaxID=37360 RepID=A0A3P3YP76_PLABS|nr:unnamed protein product [Plasmodiophora brassicae]